MSSTSQISGLTQSGTTPGAVSPPNEGEVQLSLVQVFLLVLFGLMFLGILFVYIKREVHRVSSRRAGFFDTQMAPGANAPMREEIWKRVAVICGWKVYPKKLLSEAKREHLEQKYAATSPDDVPNVTDSAAKKEAEASVPTYFYRMRAVDSVVREFQQLNPTVYRSLIDVLGTLYELLREQACVGEINEFLRAFNQARSDPDRFDSTALEAFEATLHKMCTRIRADRPAVCTGELLETYRKRIASQSVPDSGRYAMTSAPRSVESAHKLNAKRADRDRITRGRVRKLSAESGSSQVGLLGSQPPASSGSSRQPSSTVSTAQLTTSISRRSDPLAVTRRSDPGDSAAATTREVEQVALSELSGYKTNTLASISSSVSGSAAMPRDSESAELIVPDTRVRSRKWKQPRAARTATDESDDERRVVMTPFDEDDEEPAEI